MFIVMEGRKIIKGLCLVVLAFFLVLAGRGMINRKTVAVSSQQKEKSYVAIIIDDFGYHGEGTEEILALDIPLTVAVMPFSDCSAQDCQEAQQAGKEVIVHMPMESLTGAKEWVGEKGVFLSMTEEEIQATVEDALQIVQNAKGMNNHMGSAIMEDNRCLGAVMDVVAENDMFFIDSKTTAQSIAEQVCQDRGVAFLTRDVFLDSTDDIHVVKQQLEQTEKIAKSKGYAVAIGHVGPEGGMVTVNALKEMLPQMKEKGIEFVTVSQLCQILEK